MLRDTVAVVLASLTLVGCSDGLPPRAVTTGTVTYKGSPLAGARVTFEAPKAPRKSTATTDSNGRFALTTFKEGDGALVGLNSVTISKMTPGVKSSTDLNSKEYAAAMMAPSKNKGPKSEIPLKYATPDKSNLSFTVTAAGPNDFPIEIKDE